MNTLTSGSRLAASPYAHDVSSVDAIMREVCLALMPAVAFGVYLFGWPALNTLLLTVGSALGCEALCLHWLGQSMRRLADNSALLTGLLLAASMPPWSPWWLCVAGGFFAIGLGKQVYGGLGSNLFNPAMLARAALLISFPVQMTWWPHMNPIGTASAPDFMESLRITFLHAPVPDGSSGATALGNLKTELTLQRTAEEILARDYSLTAAFTGFIGGSLGETSKPLIILGGLWLLWRRIITWEIPVAMLLAALLPALFAGSVNPLRHPGALYHLCSGGLLLGAIFIATDPVTSPVSRSGRLLFGAGCGLIDYLIRTFGSFPEGIAFAVLFMNALTPLIDRYLKPRVYGRSVTGKPLLAAKWTRQQVKSGDRT